MKDNEAAAVKKPAVNYLDGLILLCFGAYALLFFLGRWDNQRPFIDLSSDMALNVAGSAAVLDHPDLLAKDAVLGDPDNIRFYQSMHIPLTRILAGGSGDYGAAVIFPLGIHVFLQLCGFYLLGRLILKSRFWGLLFAAMTAITVTLSLGEYWGVYSDPQPRFTYQALLPFLLAGAYHWRDDPKRWPWLMAIAGCLIYVHSVSAPLWGFALWLGFWLFLPNTWPFVKRIGYMLINGLVFLAVCAPFIWNYLNGRNAAPLMDFDNVVRIMLGVYPNYFRPWLDMQQIFAILAEDTLLWPGLAGLCILLWVKRKDFRTLGLVLVWIAGIFVVSILVPTLEVALFHGRSHIAFTPIWVRGLRYLVPFLMLFCLWPLAEIARRIGHASDSSGWACEGLKRIQEGLPGRPLDYVVSLLGIFVVLGANVLSDAGYQSGRSMQWRLPAQTLACWSAGRIICPSSPSKAAQLDILEHIKVLPPGSTILPILIESDKQYSLELAVRYAALQPVVFTDKDFSTYWQSNPEALILWEKVDLDIEKIKQHTDASQRSLEAWKIGERLGATYLLLDWEAPVAAQPGGALVYRNDRYALYAVNPSKVN